MIVLDHRFAPPALHELAAKQDYLARLYAKLKKANVAEGRRRFLTIIARVESEIAEIEAYQRSGPIPESESVIASRPAPAEKAKKDHDDADAKRAARGEAREHERSGGAKAPRRDDRR